MNQSGTQRNIRLNWKHKGQLITPIVHFASLALQKPGSSLMQSMLIRDKCNSFFFLCCFAGRQVAVEIGSVIYISTHLRDGVVSLKADYTRHIDKYDNQQ